MLDERVGLRGKVIVVAGAGGGGIGTAVCRLLAEAGMVIVGLEVDPDRLAVTAHEVDDVGGRFRPAIVDVRDPATVADAIDAAAADGPLHGLVHVAGGMRPSQWAPIATMSPATFADVMELNLQSAFVTTQAVAARLVAKGSGGSIVHIASISGQSAMPFGAPYAAAKAGMLALVRTAALELGGAGVRVNAVAAGTVSTAKTQAHNTPVESSPAERHLPESTAIPLGRRGQPVDIAAAVLYLLSDLAGFVTGHTLVVDGGSSARPSYLDADNLPVFVTDPQLRARLLEES